MAENDVGADDRTEEATPERREEFRDRGQVVVSRELTSVLGLAATIVAFSAFAPTLVEALRRVLVSHFQQIAVKRVTEASFLDFAAAAWMDLVVVVVPAMLVPFVVATAATFAQTRLNWSWERLKPDFSRLSIAQGLLRMVNVQAAVETVKSVAKMAVVGLVAYLILFSEWVKVPELMTYPMLTTWTYWGTITKQLFWAVAGLLLLVAGFDYFYNFMSYERKIRMTKQEVKEEYKRREVDPHVKGRIRRMQREAATRKLVENTRKATVLITNPTHYSVALQYELGDTAPKVVAKAIDFLALKMREVAKEEKIPIIENRPLARALYAHVEEGDVIPDRFYKAVAEIIRYVFKLKGRRLPESRRSPAVAPP